MKQWRAGLSPELSRDLGVPVTLTLLCPPKPIDDDVMKLLVQGRDGERLGVLLCANESSPDLVQNGMARAAAAKHLLGADLGTVILDPITSGRLGACSYAVLPYRRPVATGRVAWTLQRRRVAPSVLGWLAEATRQTARAVDARQLETHFMQPLRYLAEMREATGAMRHEAESAHARIERGLWKPRHVLMHNDLWKDNLLIDHNRFGLTIIDWPGSRTEGYGVFDLLKLSGSMGLPQSQLRAEIERHCEALGCERVDARSHLASALAELATRLEAFPVARYVQMASRCIATIQPLTK